MVYLIRFEPTDQDERLTVSIYYFLMVDKEKTFEMTINLDFQYAVFRKAAVVNALGMHARPAAVIAGMAQDARGDIWLSNGKRIVDAASIIDILSLCAGTGTKVSIFTEKKEDSAIADKIKTFFDIGFGENENE